MGVRKERKRYRHDGQYADPKPAETRKEVRTEGKVDKLNAKANLKLAKAQSRKYLLWLIIAGIAIYFILKSGGGGSAIFDKVKGLFP
tara:strand:+ start:401 stop:661 length:261 start_codon:yes stop_codon:yes gene_type:complete